MNKKIVMEFCGFFIFVFLAALLVGTIIYYFIYGKINLSYIFGVGVSTALGSVIYTFFNQLSKKGDTNERKI